MLIYISKPQEVSRANQVPSNIFDYDSKSDEDSQEIK